MFLCPESPRFLIQKHEYAKAYRSLVEIRGTEIQAVRDLYKIHAQLQVEATKIYKNWPHEGQWSEEQKRYIYQSWINRGNFFTRMWDLFTVPRNRRACVVAFIVMLSQQLCGVSSIQNQHSNSIQRITYAKPTDERLGLLFVWYNTCKWGAWFKYKDDVLQSRCANSNRHHGKKATYLHAGFGFANFLFTIPVYWYIDKKGRRPLLLVSFSGMLLSLAAVTGFFKLADPETRLILVSVISIVVFVFFYSIGAGPIPFTLSSEVFPLSVRGKLSHLTSISPPPWVEWVFLT